MGIFKSIGINSTVIGLGTAIIEAVLLYYFDKDSVYFDAFLGIQTMLTFFVMNNKKIDNN